MLDPQELRNIIVARERVKIIRSQANRIISKDCCRALCLKTIPHDKAISVVTGCLLEVERLSPHEKSVLIFDKLRSSVNEVSTGGYIKVSYNLGTGLNDKISGVCYTCFQNVYEVPERTLGRMRRDIKMGMQSPATDQPFCDRTSYAGAQCKAFVAALVKLCSGK